MILGGSGGALLESACQQRPLQKSQEDGRRRSALLRHQHRELSAAALLQPYMQREAGQGSPDYHLLHTLLTSTSVLHTPASQLGVLACAICKLPCRIGAAGAGAAGTGEAAIIDQAIAPQFAHLAQRVKDKATGTACRTKPGRHTVQATSMPAHIDTPGCAVLN